MLQIEKSTYPKIINGAREEGFHLYRLQDAGQKNPFDIGGVDYLSGRAVGLEVKQSENVGDVFRESLYYPHQIGWLKAYASIEGAYSLIALKVKEDSAYVFRVLPKTSEEQKQIFSIDYTITKPIKLKLERGMYTGLGLIASNDQIMPKSWHLGQLDSVFRGLGG